MLGNKFLAVFNVKAAAGMRVENGIYHPFVG
nr:MAG TPA: hypothetical protein [Bacteriophage sp.]DAX11765.1 MAG TPA: hypothetical protein [Bacteriophage sp.]